MGQEKPGRRRGLDVSVRVSTSRRCLFRKNVEDRRCLTFEAKDEGACIQGRVPFDWPLVPRKDVYSFAGRLLHEVLVGHQRLESTQVSAQRYRDMWRINHKIAERRHKADRPAIDDSLRVTNQITHR